MEYLYITITLEESVRTPLIFPPSTVTMVLSEEEQPAKNAAHTAVISNASFSYVKYNVDLQLIKYSYRVHFPT